MTLPYVACDQTACRFSIGPVSAAVDLNAVHSCGIGVKKPKAAVPGLDSCIQPLVPGAYRSIFITSMYEIEIGGGVSVQ